jgi:four helix bundle protein
MKDFRQLKVWQKAHQLTLAIYQVTGSFPRDEIYGLTSQMRRAAASIPSNLAEGCGRNSDAELARFSSMAAGSASELEYHLLLAASDSTQRLSEPRRAGHRNQTYAYGVYSKADRRTLG